MSVLACSCPYVHSLCLILQRMPARKILRETCSIFKRSKPKWMHRTPFSAFCTFPCSLTHFLSPHTHAHTHHHSYYCLILMSNLSLLPSFSLPSPSISLLSSRRAWERERHIHDSDLHGNSPATGLALAAYRKPPQLRVSSNGGGKWGRGAHKEELRGPSRWMLRKAWSGALTSWLHGVHQHFDVGIICETARFLSALRGTSLMIT